jgi:hypothetical protein
VSARVLVRPPEDGLRKWAARGAKVMTAPIEVSPAEIDAIPATIGQDMGARKIEGRSLGQVAWMRLKRDQVSMVGCAVVLLLVLIAIAHEPYILFRELLPNLVGPILVYFTLLIPANILFETTFDFFSLGFVPSTPSCGQTLSNTVRTGLYAADLIYVTLAPPFHHRYGFQPR